MGSQEVADHRRDFIRVGFQREMACIEEPDVGVMNVPLEQFGSRRQEEWIVLSPNCKEMRLVRPEIGLESRIQRDVALVGAEDVQLDFVGPRAAELQVVQRIAVGRDGSDVRHTMGVLPAGRFRRQ